MTNALLHSDAMQNGLVRAQRQPLHRPARNSGGIARRSRFDVIVDEFGTELGAVSERYKLTQPHDLLAAVDLIAEEKGIRLQPEVSHYRNGKTLFDITLPDYRRADGADGDLVPTLSFGLGMGGQQSVWTDLGILIGRCGNGMVIYRGQRDHQKRRNTTGINLLEHLYKTFECLDDKVDRYFRLTSAARHTQMDFAASTFKDVRKSVGARNEKTFDEIVRINRQTYGDVVWAAMQAITELQTHHTGVRKDGTLVWTSRDWATEQLQAVGADYGLVTSEGR